MNPEEFAKYLSGEGGKAVLDAAKKAMSDQFDAIGKRAAKTFHTTGATTGRLKQNDKKSRKGLSYKGKNSSKRLRIRSGDLYRSMMARGGNDKSIRKIKIMNNIVMGSIGTDVTSDDGFGYPYYHEVETGRFKFLMPSIRIEDINFVKRFDKHWKKVKQI